MSATPFAANVARSTKVTLPRWQGWEMFLLPLGVLLLGSAWPAWLQMWLLAATIFFACKWLTWRRCPVASSPWRQLGYLMLWPGLDAATFLETHRRQPLPPSSGEWLFAVAKLLLGVMLLVFAPALVPADATYLRGWLGMLGTVFVLHFGGFHVLSCAWRRAGVAALPLMHWPLLARNLSDFWSERWNRAFRDLAHRFVFRPLTPIYGGAAALWISFLMSGLVHDLVISVPAGGGYGCPTLYFLLQALGIVCQRSAWGVRCGLNGGWRGRLFTAAVLILPLNWLLHVPFVTRVVDPFMTTFGV